MSNKTALSGPWESNAFLRFVRPQLPLDQQGSASSKAMGREREDEAEWSVRARAGLLGERRGLLRRFRRIRSGRKGRPAPPVSHPTVTPGRCRVSPPEQRHRCTLPPPVSQSVFPGRSGCVQSHRRNVKIKIKIGTAPIAETGLTFR